MKRHVRAGDIAHQLIDDAASLASREPNTKRGSASSKARRKKKSSSSGRACKKPLSSAPEPGTIDPETGRLILAVERTLPTAEAYVEAFHHHSEGMTLRHYAGQFWEWAGNRYVEREDGSLRNRLLPWLHNAVLMIWDPEEQAWTAKDFPANPNTLQSAQASIQAHVHLEATTPSPSWLTAGPNCPEPSEIIATRSSLLHLPTMKKLQPTPAFFNVNALDYDHDPRAPDPKQWNSFLRQLFRDDAQALDLLKEWFGYCLTGDTSQHKMLLIVGPKRSGKGTIARVLSGLVGLGNICGPTTSSLAGPFGLQPLIGKSLGIVSDARFAGDNIQIVIERLLCISGEDSLTVDRKFLPSLTMKLPTRFVFLTNELPRLTDASGALAGRFMILRLNESFYGREDRTLTRRLLNERPGILNWSIEGWRHLQKRGHFLQPSSVEDALRDMEDLSSPVGAFVRECCETGQALRVWVDDLYHAWKRWCDADGRVSVSTKQTFGRDLAAAVTGIVTRLGTGNQRFYQGIALKDVSA